MARLRLPFRLEVDGTQGDQVWINNDIRPLPPSRRTWTKRIFVGWWAVWFASITTWQIGASLVALGLSVWQAMLSVIIGRAICGLLSVYVGKIGGDWHINYPVLSRMIWGMYASFWAIAVRIFIQFIATAFHSYIGGLCVTVILSAIFPSFAHMENTLPASAHVTTQQIIGWAIFNIIAAPFFYVRPEKSKRIIIAMNICAGVSLTGILIFVLAKAKGAGPLISQPSHLRSNSQTAWAVLNGISIVVSSQSPSLASQADFSRFAKRPNDQVVGQWFSFLILGTIFPLFGCLASSATVQAYGTAIWNPPLILLQELQNNYTSGARAGVVFAAFGLSISQLAVVTVDCGYAVGMDLAGIFPKYVTIRRGAYIGWVLSLALNPWQLLATAQTFLTVMSSLGIVFMPIIAVEIADYYVVRRQRISLVDLYDATPRSSYFFWHGVNYRSFVAFAVGFAPLLPGLIHAANPAIPITDGLMKLTYLSVIYGLGAPLVVYLFLAYLHPPPQIGKVDPTDVYGTFTEQEALRMGVAPADSLSSSEVHSLSTGKEERDDVYPVHSDQDDKNGLGSIVRDV